MKPINILLISMLLIINTLAFGQQEQPKKVNKFRISDICVQAGWSSGFNKKGTITDFTALAPQSVLLNTDFTDYSSPSGRNGISASGMYSVMMGIEFSDKQKAIYKNNPLLRMGISYFSGTNLMGNFYKQESNLYDTLISSTTGQTVYMDKTINSGYNMEYTSKQIRYDCSLIFRSNPQLRWSVYSGVGIAAGMSIDAHTEVWYNKTEDIIIEYPTDSSYLSGYLNIEMEEIKNKNNIAFSSFIPIGVDFRIGEENKFLKQLHLFYEAKPCIAITSTSELGLITNISIQHGLGIRMVFH